MEYKGLLLDRFQEEAINSIENNHSVVVSAPTGSGKTLIADYIAEKHLPLGDRVVYTAPIKALSNQKYKEFSRTFGEKNVGLLTGDIVINFRAPILIMTTEVYRNMVLTEDEAVAQVCYVVFDEIHFINDVERGYVWEESIIFSAPHVRFLCLSATIPNAKEFAEWIHSIKHHRVEVVKHKERPVPLHKSFYDYELGLTTLEDIKSEIEVTFSYKQRGRGEKQKTRYPNHVALIKEIKGLLPCFFFVFSRAKCERNAAELSRKGLFETNPKINSIVRHKLEGVPPQIKDLKTTLLLRQVLPHGIAFHHAGLLPVLKELVEELFEESLIKVLYTTETFAVGINMPAKTVVFASLRKFDGSGFRFINSKEYFQIAGRAGRRGIDKEGYSIAMVNRRDFWYKTIKKMTDADTLPIKSQFKLSVNTVLNLLKRHSPNEINTILKMSFYSYQREKDKRNRNRLPKVAKKYDNIVKKLYKKGFIENGVLTEKGEFSALIYADEILSGEIFATKFHRSLSEYQIMLLIGGLVYEHKKKINFYKTYPNKPLKKLLKQLRVHKTLKRYRRFEHMKNLTALIYPCYQGEDLFKVLKNTNQLEGDVIRFYRQMFDRIGQIKKATPDFMLIDKLEHVLEKIQTCLKDVEII
jgi:superfamily II RNA helicase